MDLNIDFKNLKVDDIKEKLLKLADKKDFNQKWNWSRSSYIFPNNLLRSFKSNS